MLDKLGDLGSNIRETYQDAHKIVWQMDNESGSGTMTQTNVLPGIAVMQNDFHMAQCSSYFVPNNEMLCIDHCREGRIEWELAGGSCYYVEAGDLNITNRRKHVHDFNFPLNHYHGFTIGIVLEEADKSLRALPGGFPVDLYVLREKLCKNDAPLIATMTGMKGLDVSAMYTMPEDIRPAYYRVKVLELLLYLDHMEVSKESAEKRYFYKTQVQKAKAIEHFLTMNLQKHYTLEELSGRFDIPLTTMKQCFKGVYGTSVYAYLKVFRMNAAAVMLRSTGESVGHIAAQMGYDNASKFSAAFKSVMGDTPASYRGAHHI
ncbi:MAG: helix-turn-helix domain-containing protein [Oscillospiraceae bacterium]